MDYPYSVTLGAVKLEDGRYRFRVWSPQNETLDLVLVPQEQLIAMQAVGNGYFEAVAEVSAGQQYHIRLNGGDRRADPASRAQADSVHGASVVVDPSFAWDDTHWYNLPLRDYVLYELHVGTFTPEGTFDAIIPRLDALQDLGITAIELMPIAQFPGGRNWGYDGVLPYAAQNTYGGVAGLKRLVNACHQRGIAVILDVVYNHLGPEGNYLSQFAPYFTERYQSPWGMSMNFDGEHSDEVRRYFIENALYWLDECHIDGLRLDATHALFDFSAVTFLEELAATVHEWADLNNRRVYLIAENDRSDVRVVRSQDAGGYGLDAQWLDDLHHAVHTILTGENLGYYADYFSFEQLVKCYREGFVFSGEYSPFRKRRHGTSSRDIPGNRFVVSIQNHDQIGNRMLGERLTALTDFEGAKLAAGAMILSPYLPMLFMGEEYAETAPFLYFVSHGDEHLREAVRKGRAAEFESFRWEGEPPDPSAEATFEESKLNWALRDAGQHRRMYDFYKALLHLRKTTPALTNPHKSDVEVWGYEQERVIFMHRRAGASEVFIALNFNLDYAAAILPPVPPGRWRKVFDSAADEWTLNEAVTKADITDEWLDVSDHQPMGLPPKSFAVYVKA